MKGFQAAVRLLPAALRAAAEAMPERDKQACEELRLRRGRCAAAVIGGTERTFFDRSVTEEDILSVVETATGSSLHTAEKELTDGFLSAPGGVRVGVCGTAAGKGGLRAFSSVSVRVPRQVRGCADSVWQELTLGGFSSTLILSPPGAGKTTLLRELCRRLSDDGVRVCIADERGEIADATGGTPAFDVGAAADVMTGVPKARAAMMLLRSMNPQVIAMDEITEEADAAALLNAVGCGVRLLATAHGAAASELYKRPACGKLLRAGAFSHLVIVENRGGLRIYRTEGVP